MSRITEFTNTIGLTDQVRQWLAKHDGDPLREEIVRLFLSAINDDMKKPWEEILQKQISRIPR